MILTRQEGCGYSSLKVETMAQTATLELIWSMVPCQPHLIPSHDPHQPLVSGFGTRSIAVVMGMRGLTTPATREAVIFWVMLVLRYDLKWQCRRVVLSARHVLPLRTRSSLSLRWHQSSKSNSRPPMSIWRHPAESRNGLFSRLCAPLSFSSKAPSGTFSFPSILSGTPWAPTKLTLLLLVKWTFRFRHWRLF
ncbi:hypothetical protein BJY00DRAFT_29070 [Aspergillus carlsbadensis]|nr:hypothetical protein BJY00DRAFT_29070 [Aspergillus carlsbadensis]